ncbi:hypothetical protein [Azorhizobium]|uniref:Uncharacterized protein n=1 Tax=Azorhizobium caulinodans (strain ATCC 43989 / DSM 5975 / JCM 20966 / LMG 6465 / NBRC 14845 / NCIMB 13405 / ORS 571) TaxID=438753 RepID=A8IE46_AZOC5|nr:hypothetical protein [Azorhizobium]TDT93487.1 hypothetical protein DFO45_2864 [Azorhizobium sp. AG788]BAF89033.1 unknown protein [Azorhizobium caulinodans ORS 571]
MTVHIGTLGEIPTTALKAPSPHRRAPNWGAFLARPIPLADGERVLERLWDAADVLHAEAGESPDAAEKALIAAAQSGERGDISDATDSLEIYLRRRALI